MKAKNASPISKNTDPRLTPLPSNSASPSNNGWNTKRRSNRWHNLKRVQNAVQNVHLLPKFHDMLWFACTLKTDYMRCLRLLLRYLPVVAAAAHKKNDAQQRQQQQRYLPIYGE